MMEKLEQGVSDVFMSDEYIKLLDIMAKMPQYSLHNQLLIKMQMPYASYCAGYTTWQKIGRYVKKGEKGIRIFAPIMRKKKKKKKKKKNQ